MTGERYGRSWANTMAGRAARGSAAAVALIVILRRSHSHLIHGFLIIFRDVAEPMCWCFTRLFLLG
jgi:hypothetical protein